MGDVKAHDRYRKSSDTCTVCHNYYSTCVYFVQFSAYLVCGEMHPNHSLVLCLWQLLHLVLYDERETIKRIAWAQKNRYIIMITSPFSICIRSARDWSSEN